MEFATTVNQKNKNLIIIKMNNFNEEHINNNKYVCHDCNKELKVTSGEEIENGINLIYDNNGGKIGILKCSECYKKNPNLTNFKECEVYSRIVGYIRPVRQWNYGKKQEYQERKEFEMSKMANGDQEPDCCS